MSAKQSKTTFTLPRKIVEDFIEIITRLDMRRDSYINSILPGELDDLDKFLKQVEGSNPPGCKSAIQMCFGVCGNTEKLNITLDQDLLDRLNSTCRSRRIPRNVYVSKILEAQTIRLEAAEHVLYAPSDEIDQVVQMMGDWKDELIVQDAEVWRLSAEHEIVEEF